MNYTAIYTNDLGESIEFSLNSNNIITEFTGLTENNINVYVSQGIGQIGGTSETQSVQPKDITINGFFLGISKDKKEQILRVIRPLIKGKIIINNEWFIEVVPKQTPALQREINNAKFQFTVVAPYPYWQKVDKIVMPLSGIFGAFKFPWNLTKPWRFGNKITTEFTNFYNGGQVEIPYTVEFRANAEVANPKIMDIYSLKYLKINKTMQANETIIVNITHTKTIAYSTISGNINGLIDIGSELYRLNVGDNIIKYSADSGRDVLDVTITASEEIAGVVV